jgi:hypothetical protein
LQLVEGKTWAKLAAWMASFALMGLALGHGNVSRLFTLRVMAIASATGALIGTFQLIVSSRTQRPH